MPDGYRPQDSCGAGRPRPRLVILDFDGTLADSWPWLLGALDDTIAHFGLHRVSRAEVEALRGQDSHAVLRALGVARWQVPRIAAHLRRLAAEAPPPPLFPGVPEMLRGLAARGVGLALASSNTLPNVTRALGPDLAGLFARLDGGASLFGKASRFRRLLRATGVPAAAAIGIGDERRDIAAARDAGIAAGAVAWGFATPAALRDAGPDLIFASPAEVVARLCG